MGLKRPLWRVNRSKGEQIYHKDGCCRVPSTRSLEQHPTFCGQDFLDIQVWLSYTHFQRKQGLIKKVKIYSPEGKLLGMTPYNYWDRSPSGTETSFLLKCDGYIDKIISVKKDVLYVHRLILPPLLALPWVLGYEEEYYFELDKKDIPIQEANKTVN